MKLPFLALAAALAGEPAYVPTRVAVDTSGLRQVGVEQLETTIEATGTMVEVDVREALADRGVPIATAEAGAARVEVALFWNDYETSHFTIAIEVVKADGTRVPLPRFECKHCGNDDLLEQIETQLPGVLEQLSSPAEAPPPAAAPAPPPPETAPPAADSTAADSTKDRAPSTDKPVPRLGPHGKAGISCLAVGTAAAIVGGVFLGLGRRPDASSEGPDAGELTEGRDYGPPGIALLAVGGTAMIAGAILLALDRGYARGREGRRSAHLRLTPSFTHVGATVAARF